MSEVFILGAGFSKAIHKSMPLLKDLSKAVRNRLECEDIRIPNILLDNDNIELWLTYLSQPQPWLKEYENLENRALFLRISSLLGDVLADSTACVVQDGVPDWLERLVNWWNERRSPVITFNYDTLIERAAAKLGIATGKVYPLPMMDMNRMAVPGDFPSPENFKLYKLHGSANWFYSGASSFQGETIASLPATEWGESPQDIAEQVQEGLSDKVPLIVPPTTEKGGYFQHETIRQTWRYASEALKSAERVYCVGYSLPLTDLGIQFFLQNSKPEGKVDLVILNRTETCRVEEEKCRYERMLGESYDINVDYAHMVAECLPEIIDA